MSTSLLASRRPLLLGRERGNDCLIGGESCLLGRRPKGYPSARVERTLKSCYASQRFPARGDGSRRDLTVRSQGDTKGPCCPEQSEPYLAPPADYAPKGDTVTVTTSLGKPMRVYVTGDPSETKAGVIMAHDIFGGDSGRHKQLCDHIAEEGGFLVCLPDLFHDSFPSEERELPLWKIPLYLPVGFKNVLGNQWSPGVLEDVEAASRVLEEKGVDRIGMIGFCYGAWVVMSASGATQRLPRVSCGVSVHPSVHSVAPGKRSEEIVKGVRCPQLVLSTSGEPLGWQADGEVQRWLSGIPGGAAEGSRVLDVPSRALLHGFATRGDSKKADVREGVDWVMRESLAFLRCHLLPKQ